MQLFPKTRKEATLEEVCLRDLTAVLGGSVGGYIPPGGCVPNPIGDRLSLELLRQQGSVLTPAQQPVLL